jgi:hypothetical protein
MAKRCGRTGLSKLSGFLVFLTTFAPACASSETAAVMQMGSRNLRCPRSELSSELNRVTPTVREYVVGCDFMYTRVHCTEKGCHPAAVKPPCIGDMPCFEEDPVTLEWRLPKGAVLTRSRVAEVAVVRRDSLNRLDRAPLQP